MTTTRSTQNPPQAREITITLTKQTWLTSNGRYHWAHKARATKSLRTLAALHAHAEKLPQYERAHITAHIHYPTNRRADPANAYPSVKAIIDGLTDAGVLPDDDSTHLIGPDMRRHPKKATPGTHQITIQIQPLN